MLGAANQRYSGTFSAGDAESLSAKLLRLDRDRSELITLQKQTDALSTLYHPGREQAAWDALVKQLCSA